MHGPLLHIPYTRFAIPDPRLLLPLIAPVLAVAALWWVANRTERIVNWLFPGLEFERSLGWLNLRAERRAKAAIRAVGYLIQFGLALLLYEIVRLADTFPALDDLSQPGVMISLLFHCAALALCIGTWLLYLGCHLLPKLKREREEQELRQFRRDMAEIERERELAKRLHKSRVKVPLEKPRSNTPLESIESDTRRHRGEPGG
jgi:hypothetical protein